MLDITGLIRSAGYLGLFAIIFAETGLLFGFFLPGDSLLFTAGFLASQEYLNLPLLLAITFSAAVLGDNFGYYFGRQVGRRILTRQDSWFFKKEYVERTQAFYRRHGGKTVLLARFFPIVRTFAPLLAGVGEMPYPVFFFYALGGELLWAIGLPLTGYFLGSTIPNADRYLLPILGVIILSSLLPALLQIRKSR